MMPSQRVRGAAIRAGNKSSNGPLRAWGTAQAKYPRRVGIRQLPGACWGSAKGAASLQIKVAPRIRFYSSLTDQRGLSGTFFFYAGGAQNVIDQTMACSLKALLFILTPHLSGGYTYETEQY